MNSGRAKPETIISVEAGGGSPTQPVAHRHIGPQMRAVGDKGVDAHDVGERQPGLAEDRRDVREAELGLLAGILRHALVRRDAELAGAEDQPLPGRHFDAVAVAREGRRGSRLGVSGRSMAASDSSRPRYDRPAAPDKAELCANAACRFLVQRRCPKLPSARLRRGVRFGAPAGFVACLLRRASMAFGAP